MEGGDDSKTGDYQTSSITCGGGKTSYPLLTGLVETASSATGLTLRIRGSNEDTSWSGMFTLIISTLGQMSIKSRVLPSIFRDYFPIAIVLRQDIYLSTALGT